MQYICCNIESMLEQRLLDILPLYAIERLGTFCRRHQMARMKRTGRSGFKLVELRKVHAEWLKDIDVAKQTGGYRRYARRNSAKSPRLSPAPFSTSLRMSPNLATSPPSHALSPQMRPAQPSSPILPSSPGQSPLVTATNAGDADLFEMDDLRLDDDSADISAVAASPVHRTSLGHVAAVFSPPLSRAPWQRPPLAPADAPHSLRDIMSQADSPAKKAPEAVSQRPGATPEPQGPSFLRLSQRDRKKQQQAALGQQATEAAEAATMPFASPWRPMMPAAWKPPETLLRSSLASIQASETASSWQRLPQASSAIRRSSELAQQTSSSQAAPAGASTPARQPSAAGQPANAASAVGAPVITPTRLQPKRIVSDYSGPPERRSQDVAWVNYTSTTFVPPVAEDGPSQSFAHIQNLQASEREAIRSKKGPLSLAEIQQEENKRREEADFLAWFEEESRKTQAELGIKPNGDRGGRGGSRGGKGRGRGEGRSRGGGDGAQRGRGRGSGSNTPKKAGQSSQGQGQSTQSIDISRESSG